MEAAAPYDVSSVHLAAFVRAAKAVGSLDKVLSHLSPEARRAVEQPYKERWVTAEILQDLTRCIATYDAPSALEEINYRMTRDSLGKMVMPMVKLALTFMGRSPGTIFSRLNDSVRLVMRGVTTEWTPASERGGALTVRYPKPPPPVVHFAWFGVFRFGFELTERKGELVRHEYVDDGRTVVLQLAWV